MIPAYTIALHLGNSVRIASRATTTLKKLLPWQQKEQERRKDRHGSGDRDIHVDPHDILLCRSQDTKLCNSNLETLSK